MIFRIPQGKHRAKPFRFWIWWGRTVFKREVTVYDNCRYEFDTADQLDINKLFGVGYLPHHHKNSARFGWRYWPGKDQIELLAYCYVDGQRVVKHIGYCSIGIAYRIELYISKYQYLFILDDFTGKPVGLAEVPHDNKRRFKYRLGCYFGGNRTAPVDMTIQIKKL
jgi:hypothetical protein